MSILLKFTTGFSSSIIRAFPMGPENTVGSVVGPSSVVIMAQRVAIHFDAEGIIIHCNGPFKVVSMRRFTPPSCSMFTAVP